MLNIIYLCQNCFHCLSRFSQQSLLFRCDIELNDILGAIRIDYSWKTYSNILDPILAFDNSRYCPYGVLMLQECFDYSADSNAYCIIGSAFVLYDCRSCFFLHSPLWLPCPLL